VGASAEEYTGAKETSPAAKEALKYALVGLLCCGIILGPLAFVKGTEAKKEIARNPRLTGEGIATAAQVIGVIEFLLNILGIFARVAGN
jgi:hypothetical protein